jgi:hypothetical protein
LSIFASPDTMFHQATTLKTEQGGQAMNPIRTALLGATALMVADVAPSHAQNRTVATFNQTVRAPALPPELPANPQQSRPLFTIGGFGVYLWAPVESPYDAAMNRNLAADPAWGG